MVWRVTSWASASGVMCVRVHIGLGCGMDWICYEESGSCGVSRWGVFVCVGLGIMEQ